MNENLRPFYLPDVVLNHKDVLRPLFDAGIEWNTAYKDMVGRFGENEVNETEVLVHYWEFRKERFVAQLNVKQELPMDDIIINKMNGEEQLHAESTDKDIDILTPDAKSKAEELVPELIQNEFSNERFPDVDVLILRNGIRIRHGKQLIANLVRCDEGSIITREDQSEENHHCNQYDLAISVLARVFEETTVPIRVLAITTNAYSLSMEQRISWKTFLTALRECPDILDQVEYLRFNTCHSVHYEIAKQIFEFRNEEYHVMTYGSQYEIVESFSEAAELALQRNTFVDRYCIFAVV